MLVDIEKFIYNDKIYSKCNAADKEIRQTDGSIGVRCGCFSGTLDEFREQVKNTREGKIAKEYLMIADLMEYHFQKRGRSGR